MKFAYTIFYVEDVVKTAQFYEKAFGLRTRFKAESGLYIEMETGQTTLSFTSEKFVEREGFIFEKNRLSKTAPGCEINFATDDVAGAYATALAAGAIPLTPPTQKHWGQTVATVRDLDGIIVGLCTPMQ
jgi:lactoylglutathione lyase